MHGYRVRTAHDSHAATAAVRSTPPDVVLLDQALPGLSGLDLARLVRRRPGMGPALLVGISGHGQDADAEPSRTAGCDHHLVKPVDAKDLLRLLQRHHDSACQ